MLKGKEILIHATTSMNLENIMLSEISQSQMKKKIVYDYTYKRYLEESNLYRKDVE